jgi:hypothetical protein
MRIFINNHDRIYWSSRDNLIMYKWNKICHLDNILKYIKTYYEIDHKDLEVNYLTNYIQRMFI